MWPLATEPCWKRDITISITSITSWAALVCATLTNTHSVTLQYIALCNLYLSFFLCHVSVTLFELTVVNNWYITMVSVNAQKHLLFIGIKCQSADCCVSPHVIVNNEYYIVWKCCFKCEVMLTSLSVCAVCVFVCSRSLWILWTSQ